MNDLAPWQSGGHAPITTNLATPGCALAVGAHPDDIELGCGATLAKWAAAGCRIHHVVLTDGAKGTWDVERDEASLVATRQEEQREAARRLGGGDVAFLGRPDGELRNGVREQWEVCRWIRTIRPDVVLGHDPWRRYRLHPDHRYAGFVLSDAVVAARDPLFFRDQELPAHRPSALLLWEADVANHVEIVHEHVQTKIHALLAHASQYESTMGIGAPDTGDDRGGGDRGGVIPGGDPAPPGVDEFERRVLGQLAAHGALAGADYGEAFHLIEPV